MIPTPNAKGEMFLCEKCNTLRNKIFFKGEDLICNRCSENE